MGSSHISEICNFRAVDEELATGGQPSSDELTAVREAGFEVVINLGLHDAPGYSLEDEPGHVSSLGMEYIHIPVQFGNPTREDLDVFFNAMDACKGRKIFLHCAANKRVSAFLGLYRLTRCKWPPGKAFELMHDIWTPDSVWSGFLARMIEIFLGRRMRIDRLDHLVLTVKDIDATVRFYESVLGMESEQFDDGRVCLKFGRQKINLHQAGMEFEPKAQNPLPGSADLCLITDMILDLAIEHVKMRGVEIIEGPVARTGAIGPILSFYFRDPDLNLIEVSNVL
jgi:protein tyrosine phosphatase (PTP) superfamily phosphohydrolase (DUF442 family)/catechol 2,3-dioxygenase-like lactoylglutathione lyase family enzyme